MSEDTAIRITLRIPEGLHAKLTSEAARTLKSMNAEIVQRLEASFLGQSEDSGIRLSDDQIEAFADAVYARMFRQEVVAGPKPGATPAEIVVSNREAELAMLAVHIEEAVKSCHLAEMASGKRSAHYLEEQSYLKYLRNLHDEIRADASLIAWREQERKKPAEPKSAAKRAKEK